tara:strand:+ start:16825 stop:17595 length:771 start_codon:yes stop_codon:yes gene_type:complete
MSEQTEQPVLRAIAAIMGEVGAVEKKGKNTFHNYEYATAADIAHALQRLQATHGLVIVPHQRKMELLASDAVMVIEFEFHVAHISGDRLEPSPVFSGMCAAKNSKGGFDDKAANKCLTAATKYFALNLFRIPTGDYHDADADEAPKKQTQTAMKPVTEQPAPKAAPGEFPYSAPFRLNVPATPNGSDWNAWAPELGKRAKQSRNMNELLGWTDLNAAALTNCQREAPNLYTRIKATIEDTRAALENQTPDNGKAAA